MKNKPISYKETVELSKQGKLHEKAEYIKKNGILFMPEDLKNLEQEVLLDMKKQIKELFDNFLEENFPQ